MTPLEPFSLFEGGQSAAAGNMNWSRHPDPLCQ